MQIPDLTATPRLVVETTRTNLLQNLRPGQIVHANVLSSTQPNGVRLQIGSTEVLAKTQLPFTPGQKLVLDVVKAGQLPELRLLQQASTRDLQAAALRTILPKQVPLGKVFEFLSRIHANSPPAGPRANPQQAGASSGNRLADLLGVDLRQALKGATLQPRKGVQLPGAPLQPLVKHGASRPDGVPGKALEQLGPELRQILRNVLAAAGSGEKPPTAAAIRQAFLKSGLFLEAALAAGQSPSGDLKANLLLLLQRLKAVLGGGEAQQGAAKAEQAAASAKTALSQLLAQTLQQTEGSLARIQFHQLASLPQEEGARLVWQFELPIQQQEGYDNFLVRLEQEERSGQDRENGQIWRLSLNFDLEPLGPISAYLTLQEKNVAASFSAEKSESARLISERLPLLDQAMTRAGLSVTRLSAHQGKNVNADPMGQPPPSSPLLDEKV